jgi:dipeptidyl aminopeptidase/acylaminoacyl peptidase
MRLFATFFSLAVAMLIAAPSRAAVLDCHTYLLPPPPQTGARSQLLEAKDLETLRDIGPLGDSFPGQTPLSLSPDGRTLAFEMHRADLSNNSYCVGLFVIDLSQGKRLRLVNVGGDLPLMTRAFRGVAAKPIGVSALTRPQWSPDGRWIAFLRRDRGINQIWRVRPDGTGGEPITRSPVDVIAFAWAADARHITYSSQPGVIAAQAALDRQARTGYPYGANFQPMVSNRPFVTDDVEVVLLTVDAESGSTNPATPAEKVVSAPTLSQQAGLLTTEAYARDGRRVWTVPRDPRYPFGATALHVNWRGGATALCDADACRNIVSTLWSNDGDTVFFTRREGWGLSQYAVYTWSRGEARPRRFFVTSGWIGGCVAGGTGLLCLFESSGTPRRIVSLNPPSSTMTTLFEPNPEFGTIKLGLIRRLYTKTMLGDEAFADLVLPPEYRAGTKLPLIVVQYESRGFLRGGTGDDYPIQLFAAHGYAVLSMQLPRAHGLDTSATAEQIGRAELEGWSNRRNVMSSIDAGLDAAEAIGVVDPTRVGITGLSDGGSSVEFAMVNSKRFAAAASSSCCWANSSFMAYLNQEAADHFRSEGYPGITADGRDFWKSISLLQNAHRVEIPLLLQLSDEEYLDAVEEYSGLRELLKPVDMIVYPDEHHIKWQPSHRDAVYRRSLAWFDFWLKGQEHTDVVDPKDYDRWRHLKSEMEAREAAPVAARPDLTSPR